MKSLTRASRTSKGIILSLILLAPIAALAMETTKSSLAVVKQLTPSDEKSILIKPKTLTETVEEYYKNNDTLLVTKDAIINTLKKVQKIKDIDSKNLVENIKELTRAAQNGAALLYKIANGDENLIDNLVKTMSNSDVVDIIKYLYLQSCNMRNDETGFTEGIIFLPEGNNYTKNLRALLKGYWGRMLVEEKSKSEDTRYVRNAQTENAFRLMCTVPERTTNSVKDTLIPFLDRFENFHITMPEKVKEPSNVSEQEKNKIAKIKEGIRIKPERYPKIGVINKLIVKSTATPDYGPEYNKETDIPEKPLIEKFIKTFPETKYSPALKNISAMYSHILQELSVTTAGERRYELLSCLTIFEKYTLTHNLRHLNDRIGSEIVLGEEELCDSAFSEQVQSSSLTEEDTAACGILLAFHALREAVRAYITTETSATEAQEAVKKEIENFYALVTEKGSYIKDKNIRSYYSDTALALKYAVSLTAEDAKAITETFEARLAHPLFEKFYQTTLDLKGFAEKLAAEQLAIKSRELAAETDKILLAQVAKISEKYVGEKKDLTKKHGSKLTVETKLGELIKKNEDLCTMTKEHFFKIGRLAENLPEFIQTKDALETLNQYLVGTVIHVSEVEVKSEIQKRFMTVLGFLKTDLEKMVENMITEAEKKGYICSTSTKGKELLKNIKRPSWFTGEKNPAAITHMKKTPHIFASAKALEKHVQLIYSSVENLSKK